VRGADFWPYRDIQAIAPPAPMGHECFVSSCPNPTISAPEDQLAAQVRSTVYAAVTVSSHSRASCSCSKDRHSMPAGAPAWMWLTESLPK
jgi:hypothetical protein